MIPYGRQDIQQSDIDAVVAVLRSDFLTQGPAIPRFERAIADRVGAKHAVAVSNATAALHIACAALELGPGDVLWTVPNTFVASANCALYCGARVDFVDIDPASWNMSVPKLREKLERAKRDRTLPKVVIPVAFSGQPTDQETIWELAKEYGFLTRGSDNAYIALGIVALSLAALVREVIGDMGLVTTIAVIGFVAVRRRHLKGHWRGLLVLTSLVLVTSAMPTLVVGARDVSFAMEPARHVARHGFSDILYKGLGSVPNSLGIASYSDAASQAGVERVKPGVRYCSPEFYGILRKLYLEKVVHHPAEVMRIYVEKARLILADSILDLAPPLGVALIIALGHFIAATALGLWRRIGFSQGLLVEGAVIVLIGLFVAQAILADPNRMYAMPLGAALVMLLGVLVEFFGRAAVILLSRSKRKSHYMHPWSEHASEMDV